MDEQHKWYLLRARHNLKSNGRQLCPAGSVTPNMLRGSGDSQTLSKALKGTRDATPSQKDAPISSAERTRKNGIPLSRCCCPLMQAWKPWRDVDGGQPVGRGRWAIPSSVMQPTSRKHCFCLPACGHHPLLLRGLPIRPVNIHVTLSSQRSSNSTH